MEVRQVMPADREGGGIYLGGKPYYGSNLRFSYGYSNNKQLVLSKK